MKGSRASGVNGCLFSFPGDLQVGQMQEAKPRATQGHGPAQTSSPPLIFACYREVGLAPSSMQPRARQFSKVYTLLHVQGTGDSVVGKPDSPAASWHLLL